MTDIDTAAAEAAPDVVLIMTYAAAPPQSGDERNRFGEVSAGQTGPGRCS